MFRKFTRAVALAAVLGAFTVTPAGGQTVNEKLSQPAAVPLDFLSWLNKDQPWLRESLAGLGVKAGYTLSNSILEADTVGALRAANRIRGFAHLAAPGIRPPYFNLMLDENGARTRCVTLFPRSIVPNITAMDFDRPSFPVTGADKAILDFCRVKPQKGAEYQGLSRNAYRERYFDAAGDLKIEFDKLNTDAAFIAEAMDHGFFVGQGDVTGRLRLGVE